MENEEQLKKLEELLMYIVSEMVKTKDAINITYEKKKEIIVFSIKVADGELGKIIGKNGLTANAIRGVIQAAAVKDKLNINVEFLDN